MYLKKPDGADLISSCSEAQTQLSADHHGLVEAPVLTADGAPALRSPNLHQHLHTALRRVSASRQTYLKVQEVSLCVPLHVCHCICSAVFLTVACRPVLGTLQRTATSWLCLQV